jgi:hypothetical protein
VARWIIQEDPAGPNYDENVGLRGIQVEEAGDITTMTEEGIWAIVDALVAANLLYPEVNVSVTHPPVQEQLVRPIEE